MKQIKTFTRLCVDNNNDSEVNEFLRTHNVKNIKIDLVQGFTYTSDSNYVSYINETIKPLVITTIIYEVEK